MNIVTWNVNSLNVRADFVAAFLDKEQPDVLGLQELKLETDKVPVKLFQDRGYHVAVHGQKQWNGVLLASKFPLGDVVKGLPDGDQGESRFIAATTNGVRVINVYVPQGQAADSPKFDFKLGFLDALIVRLESEKLQSAETVLIGDVNVAPEARDVFDVAAFEGVPTFHPLEHQRIARLTAAGFSDLCLPFLPAGTFSFWDYRGAAFRFNQGMRIDHFYGTAALASRVASARVYRDYRKKLGELAPSDHAPVAITLHPRVS